MGSAGWLPYLSFSYQARTQTPMTFVTPKSRWASLLQAPRSGYTLPSTSFSQSRGS